MAHYDLEYLNGIVGILSYVLKHDTTNVGFVKIGDGNMIYYKGAEYKVMYDTGIPFLMIKSKYDNSKVEWAFVCIMILIRLFVAYVIYCATGKRGLIHAILYLAIGNYYLYGLLGYYVLNKGKKLC